MTGWLVVTTPWIGFHRDLADGTSLQVSHDGKQWVVQACGPEIESQPRKIAGDWWDVLRALDEVAL